MVRSWDDALGDDGQGEAVPQTRGFGRRVGSSVFPVQIEAEDAGVDKAGL